MAAKPIPLTPLEKERKKELKLLASLFTNARTRFSFHKLKTFGELLESLGHTRGELEYAYPLEQLNEPITYGQIKELEVIYRLQKEQEFYAKDNPPKAIPQTYPYEFNGVTYKGPEESEEEFSGMTDYNLQTLCALTPEQLNPPKVEEEPREKVRLLTSPHQKAKLFKFQNRYAVELLDNILIHKKRAQLLRAGVGTGKTFMIAAVLRQLWDIDFFSTNNCLSPWPVLWVTRASIVEQTKRVCENGFGLDIANQVHVLNIEQLRAGFGLEFMLDNITYMEKGEEHTKWQWKRLLHPMVTVVDESQLAKNPTSTQAKIIYAHSEIPDEEKTHMICVSATPFTRVIEAGYFAVNTHMEF